MKREKEILYAVIAYFVMSMIFQLFFVNPECEAVKGKFFWQSSDFWGTFYNLTFHLIIGYSALYILRHTSITINMICSLSLLVYEIGTILYFSFLFIKPEKYLEFSSDKNTGILISLILWSLGLFISVFKYSK